MEKQNKQNIDAKAAELREKLKDESLDKCKVEGGVLVTELYENPSSSGGGGK